MYYGYCCWYEETIEYVITEVEVCNEVPNDCTSSSSSSTTTGDVSYWIIQNSWGTWWGEDGFVRYAVEDGMGICDLYVDTHYVIVDGE